MLYDILRSVLRLAGVEMGNRMFADVGSPPLRMDITFLGGQCVCPVLDERGFITADRARALVRAANGVMVDVAVVDRQ